MTNGFLSEWIVKNKEIKERTKKDIKKTNKKQ